MRIRDADYRSLFASWDLPASTVDEVLRCIRDRELKLKALLADSTAHGFPRASELKPVKMKEIERARAQLTRLVGREHTEELVQQDADYDAAQRAKYGFAPIKGKQ